MSETRPPITAGPIERAFRFLKSASLRGGGVGEGVGVAEDDNAEGVDSCAARIEIAKIETRAAQKMEDRRIIGSTL